MVNQIIEGNQHKKIINTLQDKYVNKIEIQKLWVTTRLRNSFTEYT